ncbi:hypothetical protein GCK72_008547 [Caenorhabditis remanei]|uniref:F-box domain-containing protein n=1 Tax=Caenorhabditis remanei TaxID=31234 RepID=A0A6A5GXU7_CAERE|nr:hypothetical protein GCK72_008547 [Caenorhabditis remanei]KAF1760300.1 hypothetical protein GCK72_008547 [Caenorhabditis remanei]
MESTFPLLRLSENVIIEVIKNFPLTQLFEFSLVSSKTKKLVSALELKLRVFDIIISHSIRVNVLNERSDLNLYLYKDLNDQNGLLPVDITLPVAAYVGYEDTRILASPPYNFSDWLNHIQSVFCCNQSPKVFFCQGCERFGIESLKETIGNINTLIPIDVLTDESIRKVLKCFNVSSKLHLGRNPFEEACQIQQIFIRNYKRILFDGVYSLDDMLLINSESVEFHHRPTQKQCNQFLKHWIRGSNPRLQYIELAIDDPNSVSREVLLKGIHCVDVAGEERLETCRKLLVDKFILNKFQTLSYHMVEIRRNDGTPAVIATKTYENNILHICVFAVH